MTWKNLRDPLWSDELNRKLVTKAHKLNSTKMSLLFLRHISKLAILFNGLWKQRKKSLVEQLKGVVALINPFQLCGWHALYFSPFPFSFPRIAVLGSAPRGTCYVTQLLIKRLRKGFLYVLMSSRMQESACQSENEMKCQSEKLVVWRESP